MLATQSFEHGLVFNVTNDNLDAFNQLVLDYQDIVYNHVYHLLGDPDWAEDVTQESFIKAYRKLDTYRGGSFRAWVLRIATNASYDMYRRASRHPTQPLYPMTDNGEEVESPAWLVDPASSVEKTVQQKEDDEALYRMLNELPLTYRTVITLVDVYEMNYAEVAEALHLPIGTVKSRVARARMQMKEKLSISSKSKLKEVEK